MYTLAYVKQSIQPTPTEGFNISGSEINNVNGDYYEVKIPGINKEDYNDLGHYYSDIYNYLINHNEILSLDELNWSKICTNSKCYILYGDYVTYIIPISGSADAFYYKTIGGAQDISSMELNETDEFFYDFMSENWCWKNDPWNDEESNDWTNKNILRVTSYDGNIY